MVKAAGPRKELGARYTCFSCETKFYDLHRPVPSCPKCETDQRENPELAAAGQAPPSIKKPAPRKKQAPPVEPAKSKTPDEAGEDDDEFGTTDLDDDQLDETEEIG